MADPERSVRYPSNRIRVATTAGTHRATLERFTRAPSAAHTDIIPEGVTASCATGLLWNDVAMHVAALLLANQAIVNEDGLLDIQGGGWEHFTPMALPAEISGVVVGILEFDDQEVGAVATIEFGLAQDGHDLVPMGSMMILSTRKLVPFVWAFRAVLPELGEVQATLSTNGEPIGRVSFSVRSPS